MWWYFSYKTKLITQRNAIEESSRNCIFPKSLKMKRYEKYKFCKNGFLCTFLYRNSSLQRAAHPHSLLRWKVKLWVIVFPVIKSTNVLSWVVGGNDDLAASYCIVFRGITPLFQESSTLLCLSDSFSDGKSMQIVMHFHRKLQKSSKLSLEKPL